MVHAAVYSMSMPWSLMSDLSFPFAELETPKEKEKPAAVKKGTVLGTVFLYHRYSY